MNAVKWSKGDTFTLVVSLVVIGILLVLLFECKDQTDRADKLQREANRVQTEKERLNKNLWDFVQKNQGMRERLEGTKRPSQPYDADTKWMERHLENLQDGWDEADNLLRNLKDK